MPEVRVIEKSLRIATPAQLDKAQASAANQRLKLIAGGQCNRMPAPAERDTYANEWMHITGTADSDQENISGCSGVQEIFKVGGRFQSGPFIHMVASFCIFPGRSNPAPRGSSRARTS